MGATMSTNVNINGTTYKVPSLGDSGWGAYTSETLIQLVGSAIFTGSGASKPLIAELDLGPVAGVKAAYVASRTTPSGSTGLVRLANGDVITWRNAANDGNITIAVNGSDQLTINGTAVITATELNNHINDTTAAHAASAVSNTPAGNLAATDVQSALDELQSDIDSRATAQSLTDHLNDTTDAHDASAISSVAAGNLVATDVQSALNELQSDIDSRATAQSLTDHLNDTTAAHTASAISNTPAGNLAATDVQGALNELQSDVDSKVAGLGTVVDNRVIKTSGTSGTAFEQTNVSIDDSNNMGGIAQLTATIVSTGAVVSSGVVGKNTNSQVQIPAGTTGERAAGVLGDLRYNTDLDLIEIYDGAWKTAGGGGGLIPVRISASATLEAGKLYLVDMESATGDFNLTLPTMLDKDQITCVIVNNADLTHRAILRGGSQVINYNHVADNDLKVVDSETWISVIGVQNGGNVDIHAYDAKVPISGTLSGSLEVTGQLNPSGGLVINAYFGDNANTTLTSASERLIKVTPTAERTYTLPSTGIKAGDVFTFINNSGSYRLLINSSNSDLADWIMKGQLSIMATQDTPTTKSHWMTTNASTGWIAYTGFATSGYSWTFSEDKAYWRRINETIDLYGRVIINGGGANGAPIQFSTPFSDMTVSSNITTLGNYQTGTARRYTPGNGGLHIEFDVFVAAGTGPGNIYLLSLTDNSYKLWNAVENGDTVWTTLFGISISEFSMNK
jgi:hypothetical protein